METVASSQNRAPAQARAIGGLAFDRWVTLASLWYVGGVFLDGWAHNHGMVDQTFFTPWHAVLYSGFAVTSAVILGAVILNLRAGYPWSEAIPRGYPLSLVGTLIFAVGGVGDLIWHTLFGIEMDIAALLSPTHLLLALGLALIITGPLRAAWWRYERGICDWAMALPAVLSLTFLLSLFTFFTQYADPIVHSYADKQTTGEGQALGIVSILLQSATLMSILLVAVKRWRLPFGAFALMFAVNDASKAVLAPASPVVAVMIIGGLTGLVVDLLYRRWQPAIERPTALRLFAFGVPVVIYTIYFAGLFVANGIVWTIHLWAGSIVLAGIVGWLLSYLALPPRENPVRPSPAAIPTIKVE